MSYQVDRFNGTFLVAVADGSIDTTTDLRLVGKNYAGYGEVQNENFLHLLENFANVTPPPRKISGQIWYDSSRKKLRFFDGTRFKVAGGAEVGPTAPAGLAEGDFWWDTLNKQLFTWSENQFELIGPEVSPEAGQSVVSPAIVKDENNNNNNILKIITDDEVVAIISKTDFILKADQPDVSVQNFNRIKKGITLSGTIGDGSEGITDEFFFWGTASNAQRLGERSADEFLGAALNASVDPLIDSNLGRFKFTSEGYTVGDGNGPLRIWVDQNEPTIESIDGSDIRVVVTDGNESTNVATFSKTRVTPGLNNVYDLGIPGLAWKSVNATTFIGNVTGNLTGSSEGTHKGNVTATDNIVLVNASTKVIGAVGATIIGNFVGSVTGSVEGTTSNSERLSGYLSAEAADALTIPVRTANGSINATQFIGIASNADRIRINNSAADDVWQSGVVASQYRTAKTNKDAWTIAARDGSGDLYAEVFNGTATSARYADLAEKYLADNEYSVGTVMVVGGDKEVTASNSSKQRAIGVISANPAYMMNSELEGGTYIALKGRVPVRVVGAVNKGDGLMASENGCAIAVQSTSSGIFGIALETSSAVEEKLIEAVVL
jgi:hypothetical protein